MLVVRHCCPPLLLGGAQAQTVHRVGLLSPGPPFGDASFLGAPLIKGHAAKGYVLGRNLLLERRGANGRREDLPRLVAKLTAAKAEAIFLSGYFPALAANAGTVPAVAINSGDPVGTGLIASLARPGGNLTGISDVSGELTPKRIELLKAVVPGLKRLAILFNADDAGMTLRYRATETAAKTLGIEIVPLGVREPDEFDVAFKAMDSNRPDAILMVTDVLTQLNRKRVIDYAAARKLPAIYEVDDLVRAGGPDVLRPGHGRDDE